MRICVVGGGLCGLTAAYAISGTAQVDLLERQPILGGCLSSYCRDDYTIERYYHHCFPDDEHLFALLRELDLSGELEWWKGTTGYYVESEIYPLNTPQEILRYPHLTLTDKTRLALMTLSARNQDMATLDGITAEQFVVERYGRSLYRGFFEPLLVSKFGEMRGAVSAAWLLSRVAIRSHRGISGENLGYLRGGFQTLIDALEKKIQERGGQICREQAVHRVRKEDQGWEVNGTVYDRVLLTIPPAEIESVSGLSLPKIPYQGAACMTLGLDREVTGGVYWLNMRDPAPYGAVVAHTQMVPRERYGESLVYLASYFGDHPPGHLEDRMLSDFCSRFRVRRGEIHWYRLAVDRFAGPVYGAGYRELILPYRRDGLYMAGMFSLPNYPERSMDGSIQAGMEVAGQILGESGHGA